MSNPDDIARVKEIKRLLDRIQQLPPIPQDPFDPQRRPGGDPRMLPPASESHYAASGTHYDDWSHTHAHFPPTESFEARPRETGLSPWLFVMATAVNTTVVAVLSVLITLGVVRQEPAREVEQGLSASMASTRPPGDGFGISTSGFQARESALLSGPMRSIELRPIGSPDEPLRLEVLRPAHLPLHIHPEEGAQETFILVLSGLPPRANIFGASRISSDSWLLTPEASARLQIVIPEWSASLIEVGVELRRTNGSVAARTKAWIAVPPPGSTQAPAKADQAALQDLFQRGDQLLSRGDIVAARALYERAAELGSAPAALALGSTYDPNRLWSLGVFGMVGNKDRARQWYLRAEQLGHPDAKERLKTLGN